MDKDVSIVIRKLEVLNTLYKNIIEDTTKRAIERKIKELVEKL